MLLGKRARWTSLSRSAKAAYEMTLSLPAGAVIRTSWRWQPGPKRGSRRRTHASDKIIRIFRIQGRLHSSNDCEMASCALCACITMQETTGSTIVGFGDSSSYCLHFFPNKITNRVKQSATHSHSQVSVCRFQGIWAVKSRASQVPYHRPCQASL